MPYLKKEDKSMLEKKGCKSGYKKEGYLKKEGNYMKKVGKIAPSILNKCGSSRH